MAVVELGHKATSVLTSFLAHNHLAAVAACKIAPSAAPPQTAIGSVVSAFAAVDAAMAFGRPAAPAAHAGAFAVAACAIAQTAAWVESCTHAESAADDNFAAPIVQRSQV